MFEVSDKPKMVERALLIGVHVIGQGADNVDNLLVELTDLVNTVEIGVMETMAITIRKPHSHFYIGKGKAYDIIEHAKAQGYDCIVFDDSLTPAQQRNWEKESGLCVIDRQEVILDIFASRAQTKEAVLQVGLARMVYSLPRLTRAWTHLSRQRGGGTKMRGQGETQLEADQRIVRDRIASLKRRLKIVRAQRGTQRKRRMKKPVPSAAIVGYTNVGKSSLLNIITGADILAEDKLFVTLDPTTRQVILPSGLKLLLTDTVGFVRKLPHNLVEAFKATLEEAVVADFLIHVLDISSPEVEKHGETTLEVLKELGADEKRILTVFNKIDACQDAFALQRLQAQFPDAEFISILNNDGIEQLVRRLDDLLETDSTFGEYLFPFDRYDLISQLHQAGCVKEEEAREEGVYINGFITPALRPKVDAYQLNGR
ncbi:MAG: GTPase HflX [Verrucomicrobia bacterium]|nr:GTPase HflX [Verrucomicrobiota bacterium]